MSPTMFLGRVVLPALGLLLAAALAWQLGAGRHGRPDRSRSGGRAAAAAPAHSSGRITAEGRVVAYPGAEVTVGTEVLGTIVNMPVAGEGGRPQGRPARRASGRRRAGLAPGGPLSPDRGRGGPPLRAGARPAGPILPALDRQGAAGGGQLAGTSIAAAVARRDAAKAAVDRLEAEAAKYRIVAPIDGVVISRHADPGETVNAALPLVTIVDLTRLRVEAEVDEFDIPRIALSAKATITAEGYSGRRWRGQVEEIADVVVARQTRPEDPGRPADTRAFASRSRSENQTP